MVRSFWTDVVSDVARPYPRSLSSETRCQTDPDVLRQQQHVGRGSKGRDVSDRPREDVDDRVDDEVFTHGVASFDPTGERVILWTRAEGVPRVTWHLEPLDAQGAGAALMGDPLNSPDRMSEAVGDVRASSTGQLADAR